VKTHIAMDPLPHRKSSGARGGCTPPLAYSSRRHGYRFRINNSGEGIDRARERASSSPGTRMKADSSFLSERDNARDAIQDASKRAARGSRRRASRRIQSVRGFLRRTYRTGRDARPEVPGTGRLRQRDASECARRALLRSVRRADERHRYSAKPRHPRVDAGIPRHAVTPPPDHRVGGDRIATARIAARATDGRKTDRSQTRSRRAEAAADESAAPDRSPAGAVTLDDGGLGGCSRCARTHARTRARR